MPYEIPDKVALVIGANDTQMGFVRRIMMEAARRAGLPLLEQNDYANEILQLPLNQELRDKLLDIRKQVETPSFRLIWTKGDPSPNNKTSDILDTEFETERKSGRKFPVTLNADEKERLRRRQIYYQLYGGVLGSLQEIPHDTDVIIVDLNLIYQEEKYNAKTAQAHFGKYVDDAVKAYGALEIKFNINTWTPGDADFVFDGYDEVIEATLTKGFISGFHDVIFGRRDNSIKRIAFTTFNAQNKPIATYLYRSGLEGGGAFVNNSLRTHALAHELGHAFGLLGNAEITNPRARNKDADWDIDLAIIKLLSGEIKKGIHWKRSGLILPDASGNIEYLTVFDKIRAGARALARKV